MEIKSFIKTYDNILPNDVLLNLLKFLKKVDFEKTQIIGENAPEVDFTIRRTFGYNLNNISNSLTDVHWYSLLKYLFTKHLIKYRTDTNTLHLHWKHITNIDVLKYEEGGFYTWHTDHDTEIPRTLSCIYMLNDDYEGGNLCFRDPNCENIYEHEVKSNRMIIWPSNFLYPHTVKPVNKGTRYSIVAWAI